MCHSDVSLYLNDGTQVIVTGIFLAELICQHLQAVQGQGMAEHLHRIVHLKTCPGEQVQQASLHWQQQ